MNAPLLRADRVTFSYGGEPVVHDVSLRVSPGEFVALVGPNGSGKTTLLKILLGLLRPDGGSVELFGSRPDRFRERNRLGYVPQRPSLGSGLPATVNEVVAAGRLAAGAWWRPPGAPDREAIEHALTTVGLTEQRHARVSELSGGQQQRAFIARALASEPDLLVLDEPVSGVDAGSQARFREALVHHVRAHEGAVLLVSHELGAVASDLDRVIVLKRSVRFDGPPSALSETGVSLGVHESDLPLWLEGLH
ncbi:MAG TPA: metal ABC transporter ATP-binding protein [Actinomycetota bacterium]|nr:metal ABC transporter ATP-binding protein [Actinomycetota bacterium]